MSLRALPLRALPLRSLPLLLALLLLVTGCVKDPTVELHSAGVRGVSPMGVGMVMVMKVKNKNVFDVQVRNVSANVIIGENFRMPAIRSSPNAWLRAGSVTHVEVPMTVPWTIMMPLLSRTVGSPTIGYRAKGYADVTATNALRIDRDDYAFDVEGRVTRMELVQAALRGGFPMAR